MATTKQTGSITYKLSLIGGAFSMKNRPVPEAIAVQIIRIVMGDQGAASPLPPGHSEPVPPAHDSGSLGTAKQFLAAKKPQTDVERIATLAFHLTYGGKQPHFKTKDLTKLNTDAAGPRLSNASFAARNAVNAGLLAAAGKGNKQISPLGEEVVKALPDRAAVKAALEAAPKRKRRAKPTRTKKSR